MSTHKAISVQFDFKRVYLPGDTIEGRARLNFTSPTRVNDIQVKLIGKSRTKIEVDDGNLTESHDLVFDSQTVFPSPKMAKAMNSDEYTVPAGVSEFPFQFKLPLNTYCTDTNELNDSNFARSEHEQRYASHAPNFDSERAAHLTEAPLPRSFYRKYSWFGTASVTYHIKVTVHKKAFFSLNSYRFFPFDVGTPSQPPSDLDTAYHSIIWKPITIQKTRSDQPAQGWHSYLFSRKKKYPVTFRIIWVLPHTVKFGQSLKPIVYVVSDADPTKFMDYCDNVGEKGGMEKAFNNSGNGLGIISLQRYAVEIYGGTSIKARNVRMYFGEQSSGNGSMSSEPQHFDLVNMKPIMGLGIPWLEKLCDEEYAMDISEYFSPCVVPNLGQEFSTCNITYGYKVSMKLKLSSRGKSFFPESLSFVGTLRVR